MHSPIRPFAHYKFKTGFTLSELLVSLSVLGLIAALSLPTVFNAVKEASDRSLYREIINTLSNLTASYSGEASQYSNFMSYLQAKMEYAKYCPNNMVNEGCRTTTPTGFGVAPTSGGFLLNSGVTLTMYNYPTTQGFVVSIDLNGDKTGGSISTMYGVYGDNSVTPHSFCPGYIQRAHSFEPWCNSTGERTIFDRLYGVD